MFGIKLPFVIMRRSSLVAQLSTERKEALEEAVEAMQGQCAADEAGAYNRGRNDERTDIIKRIVENQLCFYKPTVEYGGLIKVEVDPNSTESINAALAELF